MIRTDTETQDDGSSVGSTDQEDQAFLDRTKTAQIRFAKLWLTELPPDLMPWVPVVVPRL